MKDLVFIENSQAVTTSRKVAEVFDKRHNNVMRDIETIIKNLRGLLNFEQTPSENAEKLSYISMFKLASYTNEQNGEVYPMYYLNRDGFTLLAMGFTDKKALEFKLKYIAAFNKMEQTLKNIDALNSDNAADKIDYQKFESILKLAKATGDKIFRENLLRQAAKLLGVDVTNCSNVTTETIGTVETKPRSKRAKLTDEQAGEIRRLYATGKYSYRELEKMFHIGKHSISAIINNQTYKTDGYPF